jgi:hypothetical protein
LFMKMILSNKVGAWSISELPEAEKNWNDTISNVFGDMVWSYCSWMVKKWVKLDRDVHCYGLFCHINLQFIRTAKIYLVRIVDENESAQRFYLKNMAQWTSTHKPLLVATVEIEACSQWFKGSK